jgi:diadenosine tetraphosphate (Ap4A) HIT family hydrolase
LPELKSSLVEERVRLARAGHNPYVICRMPSGWLVIGDRQPTPGYCLLLPDPVVGSLNDLPETERLQYLRDLTRVGDALLAVTGAYRINYEILGNEVPALHAHVTPRYPDEPAIVRRMSPTFRRLFAPRFHPGRHGPLMEALRFALGPTGPA